MQRWLQSGAFLIALATFVVFMPSFGNEFVDFDDLGYLPLGSSREPFGIQTLVWAFTSFPGANWHPLTMLSLVGDAHLWGTNPFGYHVVNVVLHCCSVFLCCYLYSGLLEAVSQHDHQSEATSQNRRSQNLVSSLLGALLFGLHPLRVESVVWASERKDVLCLFFIISSLLSYLHYQRSHHMQEGKSPWQFTSYWMLLLTGSLAMLSKPLAVSLPLILLIIDWYPLHRLISIKAFRGALIEKIPLFLMAGGCIFMTMVAQQIAIARALHVDIVSRVLVACKALFFYLWKMLYPTNLSAIYPHPGNIATGELPEYAAYAGAVLVVTMIVIIAGRYSRLWPALGLFYVITLAPMLGLVQVGVQWVADRYSYLPSLGMSLLLGSGAARIFCYLLRKGGRLPAALAGGTMFIAVLVLAGLTLSQINVWRTTETLTTRIIEQIPFHPEAPYYTRAKYRNENGAFEGALHDLDISLSIASQYHREVKFAEHHIAKAHVLGNLERFSEALVQADIALKLSPGQPPQAYCALREYLAKRNAEERAHANGFQ